MSRTLSTAAYREIGVANSGSTWLSIVRISHPTLGADILIVNNNESIVYGGETFLPFAFSFIPPRQVDGTMQPSKITIDNVSREITLAIRSMTSPPTISTAIVMVASNGTVTKEAGWWIAELSNVVYDAMQISGSISFDVSIRDFISPQTYNTLDFPGLY